MRFRAAGLLTVVFYTDKKMHMRTIGTLSGNHWFELIGRLFNCQNFSFEVSLRKVKKTLTFLDMINNEKILYSLQFLDTYIKMHLIWGDGCIYNKWNPME